MPRRKTSSGGAGDEDEPAYLRKPVAEVAAALDDQIAKGRELLAPIDAHVLPAGGIDELSAQHSAWHNYCATYLERAFTSSALRREFEGVFIGGFGGPQSAMDRIRDLAYDLRRDINKLVDIKGRLALYGPPAQHGVPAPPPPAAPARPHPINVTIHGQVGQLNISDLIQHAEASIEQVDRRGEAQLADALRQVADAIKSANDAAEAEREDALDAVAVLAEVGALPAEQRGKMRGRVRSALSVIRELADTVPSVLKALEAVNPIIRDHLPHHL